MFEINETLTNDVVTFEQPGPGSYDTNNIKYQSPPINYWLMMVRRLSILSGKNSSIFIFAPIPLEVNS